jgi:glyoxylase-like metal-dependent hydrolase (beta-lactamase superfamily II)
LSNQRVFGYEIADGAHSIGPERLGLWKGGYSRSYLFEDGDELTLVDTGWDDDPWMILRYLASIDRSPRQIKHIALTHAHRSHLGGLATLAKLSGATVWAHAAEAPIIERQRKARPIRLWPLFPARLIIFRAISWTPLFKHTPCTVARKDLAEGSLVGPLEAIHTPGHTEGHMAFYYRASSVMVVGDAVATWPAFMAGWPGFNLDEEQYRVSLVRLVEEAPDVVGPGHGPAIMENTQERLRTLITGPKFAAARARVRTRSSQV